MTRLRFILVVWLALFSLFATTPVSAASKSKTELMSLDELRQMLETDNDGEIEAYFKSVQRGRKPTVYNIKIRTIHKIQGLDIILFVMKGKIVAGMSGGPVYIGNKLVGAASYKMNSFNFENYAWGGITPIERMIAEANQGLPEQQKDQLAGMREFYYEGKQFVPISLGYERMDKSLEDSLLKSGQWSKSQIDNLKNVEFIHYEVPASRLNSTGQNVLGDNIEPGMPIIVDLFEWTSQKGDSEALGVLGTITYVDDEGKIFAFGHPFLDAKKVDYTFRTSTIAGTSFSELNSYKIGGEASLPLGTMYFDSMYGVYGTRSADGFSRLHRFNVEFKNKGQTANRFNISVANTTITPVLAQMALGSVGRMGGAPISQEMSIAELYAEIGLTGYKPIIWDRTFSSSAFYFGFEIVRMSSYDVAIGQFFMNLYPLVFNSSYDFDIKYVDMIFNFVPGREKVLKLVNYKFPSKIIYGEDPALDLLLNSQDNSMAFAARVRVNIDWPKVEKPVYTFDTSNLDKEYEKKVFGVLTLSGRMGINQLIEQREKVSYFLNPDDFLQSISASSIPDNRNLFAEISLTARSDLSNEQTNGEENIIDPAFLDEKKREWSPIAGGLKERALMPRRTNLIYPDVNLPSVPAGYVVDESINLVLQFEVVLSNESK